MPPKTLTPTRVAFDLLIAAVRRAFEQAAELPVSLLPLLVRSLRWRMKHSLIDACEHQNLPTLLEALLDELLSDLEILQPHRMAILDVVGYELSFLFNENLEEK